MNASQILSDQVIQVKKGRFNSFGFEPLWNAYFDFYLDAKWFGEPLLELQDVTFHLYLRKNLNDNNKNWKMPTYRQMEKKFKVGYGKLEAMMKRLDAAHLLKKESGVGRENGMNTRNNYILSDPIATLDEFLTVAGEGGFGVTLNPEWVVQNMSSQPDISIQTELEARPDTGQTPCLQNRDTHVSEIETRGVSKTETDQQTLNNKQTSGEQVDPRWQIVLDDLQVSLPAKTFERFLDGTDLIEITNNTAVIGTTQAYARDWIENRLSDRLKRLLGVAAVRCVVLGENGA